MKKEINSGNLSDLDSHKIRNNSLGQKTAKALKNKKIKSPPIKARIHVKGKTWMVPNRELKTEDEIQSWRQEMIEKYNL